MLKKVFILEDDDIASFILQKELERHPSFHDSIIFENGEKAMQHIMNQPNELPDLIFLDINMPIMDGWEFLDELKTSFPDFKVPIAMLTSSINPEDIENSKKHSSVIGFFSKPISQDILTEISQKLEF